MEILKVNYNHYNNLNNLECWVFWLYIQRFISYNVFILMEHIIGGGGERDRTFCSTPTPLSNFQRLYFLLFFFFFFLVQALSALLLSLFAMIKIICLGFFVCLLVRGKKKYIASQDCLVSLLAFCGGLCWRHFRSLNVLHELVLFYVMETFQDS